MKLLGVKNDKIVIASISHYDCIIEDDLLADGGQILTNNYAGYTRFRGEVCWFEIPQTYAELYEDYNLCKPRKYGIWKLEDVRLLNDEEFPDPQDPQWKIENAIWGTRGKNGEFSIHYIHLKDATKEHLESILLTERISDTTREIINHILRTR